MPTDAERRREEDLISACARHTWHESSPADFLKWGIQNEEQLKDRIRQVLYHPDTRVFQTQPKMDLEHRGQGEQFGREVYMLRELNQARNRIESTTVILNPNVGDDGTVFGGTAWVSKSDQLEKRREQERAKHDLTSLPEVLLGGRAALLEREEHRQIVEYVKPPVQERQKSFLEVLAEKQQSKGQTLADLLPRQQRRRTRDRAEGLGHYLEL